MRDSEYAIKYAYLYTVLIAIILLAPLFIYISFMKKIYDVKNEMELKDRAVSIVRVFDDYNSDEEYFEYPRFKTFTSGIYDIRQKSIFTLIKTSIKDFAYGYHTQDGIAYYVMPLPDGRYFDARYLVVQNSISYYEVYEKALLILISIFVLIFMLSLFFLNRFARPFKEVNKKLDNFIKDSIHEINTPLTTININVDLFLRNHEDNKYLKRIKASAKILSNIYQDMEYLIKYDKLKQEKIKIELKRFLEDRVEYFSQIALLKNIEIVSSLEDGIFIEIDQTQLQRLVDNNISNAIKYSHEQSSIEIKLELNQDQEVLLSFRDFGVGIEDTKKIFDRYYRENKQTGGFGIGLNIVGQIAQSQNIKVTIDSKPKKGTTFTYKFPKTLTFIDN
ncbi:MAG: HAMP domain-containing sensor histidine kinase [Sulfurimonas sp.]|nr:HAMP domain-containing sensor histidine kinase [Sulfurimonadaceae bacterium]